MPPVILTGLLLLLAGCEDPPPEPVQPDYGEWGEEESYSSNGEEGEEGEEVIQDNYYEVIDRRQAGGKLYDDPTERNMDGGPIQRREPMEYMIVVRGDQTGEESAYLLPSEDFNQVRVGTRLRESTLSRWEPTGTNHIPPDVQESDSDSDDTGMGRVREKRSPFDPTYEPF